jgi:PAS domain S-box-containing protein
MGAPGHGQREGSAQDVTPDAVLGAVIEMSDDAIFTCDSLGTVTTWSRTAELLFGFRAGQMLAGPLDGLFPAHLQGEVRTVAARVLSGERIKHFETEVLRRDGLPMPVSLSLCPIFDEGERLVGAVVIARDVTEQRLEQATLAEVEARLEEGEALAHVGSWLWDLRTGSVQWSAEFHRIHGVDPLDFDGTFDSHLGLIHPEDRAPVRAAMEESVESGRSFEDEYRIIRADQQVRIVRARGHPTIGSAGRAVGLRGIGQDVTELPAPRSSPG